MALLPEAKNCDISVKRNFQLISDKLGYNRKPTWPSITLTDLTATRLVSTDANKLLESTDIASWISGTTGQITVTDDGDGTVTHSIPNPFVLPGKLTAGAWGSPLDVTGTRKYGFELHYSGNNYDVFGIRSRANLITTADSSTRTATGAELQAANSNGISVAVLCGAKCSSTGKSTSSSATISTMRAVDLITEWGAKDTVTNLYNTHIKCITRNSAGEGSFGTGYGIYLENIAVGGTGQALDAGIYFKDTDLSGGNEAFSYGIDFSGATYTNAEIKLSNSETIGNLTNGQIDISGKLHIDSSDGSNYISIEHDDTDVYFKTDDGSFIFQTDEGTNTATYLDVKGKGTGSGYLRSFDNDGDYWQIRADASTNWMEYTDGGLIIRSLETNVDNYISVQGAGTGRGILKFYNGADTEWIQLYMGTGGSAGRSYIDSQGTSPGELNFQSGAAVDIYCFFGAAEGETKEFKIRGRRTGDSIRTLEIGVGVDAANTASFDGLQNYLFGGNLITLNDAHEDTDGGGETYHIFKRQDGSGTETSCAQIEGSHDGVIANNQLGKLIFSVNTGAALAQALEIGSDLLATFAGGTVATTSVLSETCTVAAGLNVLRVTGLQTDGTAMTGTLRGAYIDVSNGSTAATGTIRGMELKARTEAPGDTGNDVTVLEGLSISADSKGHSVTTMRAAEFILDGASGGTITEAVGLRIANNLQANKATTSYGIQIYRDSFDYTADIQLSNGGLIGGTNGHLTVDTSGYAIIKSADLSDQIQIYHDNTNAWMKWNDGTFVFQTDEGTNTHTYVDIRGKGTGTGLMRIFDEDNAEYFYLQAIAGQGHIRLAGTALNRLRFQASADTSISMFQSATEGETQELYIYGFRTGDGASAKSLEIGVGVDAADTASFDGVGNYLFDGIVKSTALSISNATFPYAFITHTDTSSYGAFRFYESATLLGSFSIIGSAFATAARRNNFEITSQVGDLILQRDGTTKVGIGGTDSPDTMLQVIGDFKCGDDNTNYTNIASDGTQTMVGTARVTKYAWIPVGAVRAQAGPGTGATETTNDNNYLIISFANGVDRWAQANIKVPDDMDLSADSYLCLGWSSTSTTGAALWDLKILITAPDDSTDQAGTSDTGNSTAPSGSTNGLVSSPIYTIAGGTIESDDVCIHTQIMRDGSSDTLGAAAELHGMALLYTANKLGEDIA